MKILRSPELMQLLSVKSMMRYGPPKYTAGLARSFVSGYRRSPTPPASTITRISSSTSGLPLQNDARRRTVAADDTQGQTVHFVHAGLDFREIERFDDHHALREQRAMRGSACLLELLDRQVVDADDLDPLAHQVSGTGLGEMRVVLVETFAVPQGGVRRLEQHAQIFAKPGGGQLFGSDSAAARDLHDSRP